MQRPALSWPAWVPSDVPIDSLYRSHGELMLEEEGDEKSILLFSGDRRTMPSSVVAALTRSQGGRESNGMSYASVNTVPDAAVDPVALNVALYRAASAGDGEALSMVLASSPIAARAAAIDATEHRSGETPLYAATRVGSLRAMRALLAAGAHADAACAERTGGATPLHAAAWSTRLDLIEALLDAGAPPDAQRIVDGVSGVTPLHLAAGSGAISGGSCAAAAAASVAALLRAGAAVDARDGRGRTPLMAAAEAGNDSTMVTLLRAGAAPNAVDVHGDSALGSRARSAAAVAALVAAGADVRARHAKSGETPLHAACAAGLSAVAVALLAAGADASARDASGRTPADVASDSLYFDIRHSRHLESALHAR